MQKSFIDAVSRPREDDGDPAGFLFITDDVLLNLGQLTQAANVSGCDVIWRAAVRACDDVIAREPKDNVLRHFLQEFRNFYHVSDEQFRAQLTRNMGGPSMYCKGCQPDFLYMPASMAARWATVAQQMTDKGLLFPFAMFTALFGIAPMEDMLVLRTWYLHEDERAVTLLAGKILLYSVGDGRGGGGRLGDVSFVCHCCGINSQR